MGYEGNLNRELIISLAPDLLMAYGVADPSSGSTSRLSDLGVRVFYNADYLEQHPLARAEWIKLFGLLTGREEMADSIISSVSASYMELAERVKAVHRLACSADGCSWEDVCTSHGKFYIGGWWRLRGGDVIFRDLKGANSVRFQLSLFPESC